jgi:hypothetical protein
MSIPGLWDIRGKKTTCLFDDVPEGHQFDIVIDVAAKTEFTPEISIYNRDE